MGRIPIYLYDDQPWIPYKGTDIDIRTYGYAAKVGELDDLVSELKAIDDEKFRNKLNQVKNVRRWFTYEGVIHQIALFIHDPLGSRGGYLRCTRVPDRMQ